MTPKLYLGEEEVAPNPSRPKPTPATPTARVTLEVMYTYHSELADDQPFFSETGLAPARLMGARIEFPINASDKGIQNFSSVDDFEQQVNEQAAMTPTLWLARPHPQSPQYILATIGSNKTLTALQIDSRIPSTLTEVVKADEEALELSEVGAALGGPQTKIESLIVWLETDKENIRLPLPIGALGHATDVAEAQAIFGDVYLALYPLDDRTYQLLLTLIIPDVSGPGDPEAEICDKLEGHDGRIYNFLRWLNSC